MTRTPDRTRPPAGSTPAQHPAPGPAGAPAPGPAPGTLPLPYVRGTSVAGPDLSLYLVTDGAQAAAGGRDVVAVVTEAVAGGVTAVQVREKHAPVRDVLATVRTLADVLPDHVALFVNDRVDVFLAARATGARLTGVHVGQDDLPPEDVRDLVGPDVVIGVTARTPEQVAAARASSAGIGYLGVGAVRTTATKPDVPHIIGVDGAVRLARAAALPAVAIGGVVPTDLPALRAGGLAGAAVISWVCAAADPRSAATELARAWEVAA